MTDFNQENEVSVTRKLRIAENENINSKIRSDEELTAACEHTSSQPPENNRLFAKRSFDTKKLVGMAMFAALSYAVTFIFRIPVMFLTFDAKDAVITIASLMYGPVSGIAISFVVALVEMISVSSTGVYGFIMNFASSAVFSSVAALIYKLRRNHVGALIAFYSASAAMVGVMMLLNMFVTPYYMGAATAEVMKLIPTLILPFNVAKALLNSAFAMLLYKPVTIAMRKAKLLKGKSSMSFNRSSAIVMSAAALTLAVAVTIFVILSK